MAWRSVCSIGAAVLAVGLLPWPVGGQDTSGPVIHAQVRGGADRPLPDGEPLPQADTQSTISKLRATLYEAIKREKLVAQQLDAAQARVVRLEAEREPMQVELDNLRVRMTQETARLQADVEHLKAALRDEEKKRAEAAAQAASMANEGRRLQEQAAQLQEELARLTRVAAQAAPPTTAVASAAAVWAPGADSPAPDFDALIIEANRLLRLGDSSAAVERFEQALALRPGEPRARLGLAAGRYAQGRAAEAMTLVEDLLDEDRDNPQALGMKALIVWREGDLRQADRLLDRALKLAPEDVRLRNYRGIVAFERRDYADALDDLEVAVNLDPQDPESRFNLAVLLARRPDPNLDAAREHYQAALQYGGNRDEELEKVLAP